MAPGRPLVGAHHQGEEDGGGPPPEVGRLRAAGRCVGGALLQALPPWILSRVLVLVSLIAAHLLVGTVRPGNVAARSKVHQGLLSWDAGWYQSIAGHGYAASGVQSVRFFPAFPMVARVLGSVTGVGVGAALIVVANLSALAAMAALLVLVRSDFGDSGLARRSMWLLALAPPAYSLVLGYADASLLLCAVVTVWAARTGRWWTAAAAGLVAGLLRPLGVLLVVPVAIEEWRAWRGKSPARRWPARLGALAGPLVGTAGYLVWVGAQFGDPWLPFRVQQQNGHRGVITLPVASMAHNLASALNGHHLGSALHVPWVILCLVLLVVAFRRLPASYSWFAAAVLAVSLTSSNLDSFERYTLGAFPLVIAASLYTARRGIEVTVLVVAAAAMVGYATLAFMGMVVP